LEYDLPGDDVADRSLTWDLVKETPWVRSGEKERTDAASHLPPVDGVSYRQTTILLLQLLLHPAFFSRSETLQHLVELGELTLPAARAAYAERPLKRFLDQLMSDVSSPSKVSPQVPVGSTPRESMLLRFAVEELTAGHPGGREASFCSGLFLLGDEGLPLVRRCLESEHPFLRRNAVWALGRYDPAAVLPLAQALLEDPDRVVRNRALSLLERIRAPMAQKVILDRLQMEKDEDFIPVLVRALGGQRNEACVPTLLAVGRRLQDNPDIVWAVASEGLD
jgi:hypothetical protein